MVKKPHSRYVFGTNSETHDDLREDAVERSPETMNRICMGNIRYSDEWKALVMYLNGTCDWCGNYVPKRWGFGVCKARKIPVRGTWCARTVCDVRRYDPIF